MSAIGKLNLNGTGYEFATPTDEQTQTAVNAWLDDHPEATTTVQDGSITEAKLTEDLIKSINANVGKKMWSIQTNSNQDNSVYQLGVSADGYGNTLIDGYNNFLEGAPAGLGTDWVHYQHDNYHVFTITHYSGHDCYIAITSDFKTWVHGAVDVGFKTAGSYTDPYVWTPQLFDYNGYTYLAATVQEDAPDDTGSRYQTKARKSAIYVVQVNIDYDTASVEKVGSFTRITFGAVTDKQGETHDITGYAMDAYFVPLANQLVCIFNDRYMLEIHAAAAANIAGTFDIIAPNIFKLPYVEAPTVLQIGANLWKISACCYVGGVIGKEGNITCYTSDFVNYSEYGYMHRYGQIENSAYYTGRMRNPSFFYMTDAEENEIQKTYDVRTIGYNHIFEPIQVNMNYAVYNVMQYTDVAIPANTEFIIDSTTITFPALDIGGVYGFGTFKLINNSGALKQVTYNDTAYNIGDGEALIIDYKNGYAGIIGHSAIATGANVITASEGYSPTDCSARVRNGIVTLNLIVGSVKLLAAGVTIGTLPKAYRPSKTMWVAGWCGSGSTFGTAARVQIHSNGTVTAYAQSDMSSVSTLRVSATYSIN